MTLDDEILLMRLWLFRFFVDANFVDVIFWKNIKKNIYIFVGAVCRFVFVVVVIVVWFLAHVIFVDALCVDVIFVVAIFVGENRRRRAKCVKSRSS